MTLLCDFYELTMAQGFLNSSAGERTAVFEMFYRSVPAKGGYVIFAGLETLSHALENLSFSKEDIEFLRGKNIFCEEFLHYLADFKFECDIWSVPEGTVVFPNEPLLIVKGPAVQAQFIETLVLVTINHQSLIATKASRIVRAAAGAPIMEFGSRRAQGYDGALLGARAAYIGGCSATACTMADRVFGIPAVGTMAHSWVQMFDTEYEAFARYAETYPDSCTLLIDTYDTLRSGLPNAIRVFKEVILPTGHRPRAVRIDSGDLAYLSKIIRERLDAEGFSDVKIMASNALDEYIIRQLNQQGAKIDSYGVGENLITGRPDSVLGGVYKLAAASGSDGRMHPKIKISESVQKITLPGHKKLFRFYSKSDGLAFADYVTLEHESDNPLEEELTIFDPNAPWKKKTIAKGEAFAVALHRRIFAGGRRVYEFPAPTEVRAYCERQLGEMWEEVKRFEYPHKYYVDLSRELWELKAEMLMQSGAESGTSE